MLQPGECLEDFLQSPLVMTDEFIIDVFLQVIDIIEHLQVKHNITLIDCRGERLLLQCFILYMASLIAC
jgi:hypothetical protein